MKIAFHSNDMCVRGASVAMYDYADYNETILGNNSICLYDKNGKHNDGLGLQKFEKRFDVFAYDHWSEVAPFIARNNIDILYMIKGGEWDGKLVDNCKTCIHAVFQNNQPHGDVYAYVSEWLSKKMSNGKLPFVPHIVQKWHIDPYRPVSLYQELGIPYDAFVFGRYGGATEFDIPEVKEYIKQVVNTRDDIYFLFMNTNKFYDHKQIVHVPATTDMEYKARFTNTCDAMIHARRMGESFGLAICEFLAAGKPVFAFAGGADQHHVDLLKNTGNLYTSINDLNNLIAGFNPLKEYARCSEYRKIVEPFLPDNVMRKFKEVFIDG